MYYVCKCIQIYYMCIIFLFERLFFVRAKKRDYLLVSFFVLFLFYYFWQPSHMCHRICFWNIIFFIDRRDDALFTLSFFISLFLSLSYSLPIFRHSIPSMEKRQRGDRASAILFIDSYRASAILGIDSNRSKIPTRSRGKFKRRYDRQKFNCARSSPLSREVRA